MKHYIYLLLTGALLLGACSSTQQTTEEAVAEGERGVITPNERLSPDQRLSDILLRTPGVYITRSGEIRVRGSNQPPLFVVDGVPIRSHNLDFLNAADVASIKVLSGAEATIYGSRGGAGVIEITTKRGGQ